MLPQHGPTALRARGKHRRAALLVVLVVLAVLVDIGAPAVARHGATSLQITVWRDNLTAIGPPSVKVFDKTVTDLGLVHAAQDQLDGGKLSGLGGCNAGSSEYVYQFRFVTLGVTTQMYSGSDLCRGWDATTLGIPRFGIAYGLPADQVQVRAVTLNGVEIEEVLHQRTGMPCEVMCSGPGPSDGDTGMPCKFICP